MSVNQDNNTLVKRKRQIPEIPKEHDFLDEKMRTLKSSRSSYIGKITCNINKISKYLNSKSAERDKIYLCIEKLDKYIHKIKTVSWELQSYVFEKSAKKYISEIYTDQKFRIIEIKKSVEAHNPIIPYLTKTTKESASSTSVYSESKYSKSKFANNSGNSTLLKTKYSTKGSHQSGISSITSELSNDHTSYLTVVERRKTAEEAKLIVFQAKERAKRKIELLEKTFEIEKMHLRNAETEVQNRAELAKLAISLEEKVDLSEI